MKIIGLKADGFKKLKAIEMKFEDKGFTFIKGNNKEGKTSILDCIEYLFKGKSVINPQTIGYDTDTISAEISLENYTIKRIQTEDSDKLEVKDKRGGSISHRPQAFLDNLINDLTFNPFPFLNKTTHEKLKFMMDFVGIDFIKSDEAIKGLEEERLFIGRKIKDLGEPIRVEKTEKVNVNDLLEERDKILQFNSSIEGKIIKRSKLYEEQKTIVLEIQELEKTLEIKKNKLKENSIETLKFPKIENKKSTEEIDDKLKKSEEINKRAQFYEKYILHETGYNELKNSYIKHDNEIKELRQIKIDRLKETKTGIDGLEIREDGLYYNNIFSENWSDSEGIQISCMLSQIKNPELKAVFIDRGESFDNKTLNHIEDWAISNNIQCVITKVETMPDSNDIPGNVWFIEDGRIV